MQCNITMKYKDAHTKTKSIYRPGDTEKTVKLSSEVSPEKILHRQVSIHVQFQRGNKKLKRERR